MSAIANTSEDIFGDNEVEAPIDTQNLRDVTWMQAKVYFLEDSHAGLSWMKCLGYHLILLHRSALAVR